LAHFNALLQLRQVFTTPLSMYCLYAQQPLGNGEQPVLHPCPKNVCGSLGASAGNVGPGFGSDDANAGPLAKKAPMVMPVRMANKVVRKFRVFMAASRKSWESTKIGFG
jgi:hypothetical protein